MPSLEQLTARWRYAADEPAYGAHFSTKAGDAAKRAAYGEAAAELEAAIGSDQTSQAVLGTLAQSLRQRCLHAQQESTQVGDGDPREVASRHEEWLGRAAAYALCAAEVQDFLPSHESEWHAPNG